MGDFQWLQTRDDLAWYLNIPLKKLTYLLYGIQNDKLYSSFEIPKRNGGYRTICAPIDDLKHIQRRLADRLSEFQRGIREENGIKANVSYAFEKGRGIIENASQHKNKKYILNFDLKNFFESFHFGRVLGYFEKNRYFLVPHEAAVAITQLVCFNGHLPQGSPSSPVITNLICQTLDYYLIRIAKKYRLDYTRYADDITFSTNNTSFYLCQEKFMRSLTTQVERAGFLINDKKTRMQTQRERQEVTGLVVNKKVNINRQFYRKTRAMAHTLYTQGRFEINGNSATINQLEGRFSFIDQVDGHNRGENRGTVKLNAHEKQYQKFLFYKYFFASDAPAILTEGVSDRLYLKAALKALYRSYPNLITFDNGKFRFKIKFINRSSRMERLFRMSKDGGGDSFSYLYNCFTGRGDATNYFEKFTKICKCEPKFPTIILLDNESSSGKPLRKFINGSKNGGGRRFDDINRDLKSDLYSLLVENSKFYILTLPLIDGRQECEIEDLFCPTCFDNCFGNRKFDRSGKENSKGYYHKSELSKYVLKNYENIDFSAFVPLLDALNKIVAKSAEVYSTCALVP